MINEVGRELPEYIEGYGQVKPFQYALDNDVVIKRKNILNTYNKSSEGKYVNSIKEVLLKANIKDGMTISFHHHLRNGDKVLNHVLQEVANMGIKDIKVAASSIFPIHKPLVKLIEDGVVTQVMANYISGPVADAISSGKLKYPAIMHTHGGRARSIESGDLNIDIAFIGAPTCDTYGNINGVQGTSACGTLGYAVADAMYANIVVAVTDNLVEYPAEYVEISQEYVDYVTTLESIGDPSGIVSGTTQITKDPIGLKIACDTGKVIEAAGFLKNGLSFQTGAGGTSLAVAHFLKKMMHEKDIKGSFASGGITGYLVDMLNEGYFRTLVDVQCFDLDAINSYKENRNHQGMSASKYGNPHNKGAVVDQLDVMILGATEIDLDFNVNVTTGSDGRIMGGSGGHSDTAAGSKLAIVVTQLIKGRIPIVKDNVTTVTTPGRSIDVLVTERGIAVNPENKGLAEKLKDAGLNVVSIKELKEMAEKIAGKPEKIEQKDDIVAIVEYRDGTVIDLVKRV
ncbi:citrate lyase subunit alpha [Anaeromicrobium sediminis]|uniref:Citrate lyase alpha chain n=1 Tax=Anaeromicrobium sediminis TaxID=1478221 RepID=A0A267MKY1_9FIRM|nr:citrate lyase subunit alpha [Anaeromicrobium sediminis]PAB60072.1 citrate lyase subunit alpha [Anaeromicrobium sediminis]